MHSDLGKTNAILPAACGRIPPAAGGYGPQSRHAAWRQAALLEKVLALLRIGAKEEGILRYNMVMRDGRYWDSVCFSIIESEWRAVKATLQAKLEKQY